MFEKKYDQLQSWFMQCNDEGQSTAEYSLVILGAAAIAGLLLAWAGSSGAIGNLFDSVIDSVSSKI